MTKKKPRGASQQHERAPVIVDVDADWFRDCFARAGLAQKDVAARLPGPDGGALDPSQITRFLQGRRHLQAEEAAIIAKLLGKSLEEVLSRAGKISEEQAEGLRTDESVEVKGWVDAGWIVHWGEARGPKRVSKPIATGENVAVVRVCVEEPRHYSGALIYFHPVRGDTGRDLASGLDRLCLVKIKGSSQTLLREVRRGWSEGTYKLLTPLGQPTHEDVRLESVTPITLMALA